MRGCGYSLLGLLLLSVSAAESRGVAPDELQLRVGQVTSSAITLSWRGLPAARAARLYLSPEPARTPGGELPEPRRVTDLPADATSHTVTGIAAAADLFVRVEVESGDGKVVGENAHARTLGGPRVHLDTPLREAHLYGAKVLMLVLENASTTFDARRGFLVGDLGSAWQQGAWTALRGDGRSIRVTAVFRHSLPVGQPRYTVGYQQPYDDTVVDVDHRIFLVLDEAIGSPEWLTVAHTGAAGTALRVSVPFSDRYLETPLIQVNQVGYNPRASRRWAYLSGWMGDGGAVSASGIGERAEVLIEPLDPLASRRAALSGLPIALRGANDSDAGGEVAEIDLARLPAAEGRRYRVRVPGVGVSWPTAVSEEAVFRAFYVIARGLFHQRWYGDLAPQYTEWSRPPDHGMVYFTTGHAISKGFFPRETPQTDPRPLRAGHRDAGDFDIAYPHVLVGQHLMRSIEVASGRLLDGQLTIPESGNGIPDLLDEALWSVEAWRQLQNPDGSIRSAVESWRHPLGIQGADEDRLPYWTADPMPWHTGYAAALLAQAAHLVAPYDAPRAVALETAARKAYDWAAARGAPAAYLLYAAGELYRRTRELRFEADYQAHWSALNKWGGGPFDVLLQAQWLYPGQLTDHHQPMADFTMAYALSHPGDALTATTLSRLTALADRWSNQVIHSPHAHRNGRDPSLNPDWGLGTATGRHVDGVYQRLMLGDLTSQARQDYFDALSLSADYVLGCNPNSYSFITGLGSRYPREPLHLDSLAFIKKGMPPVPGIPVYGVLAGEYPRSDYYKPQGAAFYPAYEAHPLMLRVSDTRASVDMNEFTVWDTQAPLVALFAAAIGPGMTPPAGWKPGGPEHRSTLPSHVSE